jgi:AcrR family transcriptional regulator
MRTLIEQTQPSVPQADEDTIDDGAVLDAAARLLAAGGSGLTMRHLAAATGISRATLYRRYGGRAALIHRLVRARRIPAETAHEPDMHTRILAAARTVFAQSGFAAATVEQIAQAAEVGPATVYRHFTSKEGLIAAFLKANSPRRLLAALALTPSGELEDDLAAFATVVLTFLDENRDVIRLALLEGPASPLHDPMQSAQDRTVATLADYLEPHIRAGVLRLDDSFSLALTFVGILFGHGFIGPLLYNRPPGEIPALAQWAVRRFLDGCAAPQEERT